MFAVTSIYAGALALLYVGLSARVILWRRSHNLSLGDGGDAQMTQRIRAHGNCAEYLPIGLILLALTEAQGAPAFAVHLLGLMLLAGRALHGYAFLQTKIPTGVRVLGMSLTFLMLIFAALGLVLHGLF